MSRENIEVVRLAYDVAYAQRSVEGVRDSFAPDFVFHSRPEFPGRQLYRFEEIEQLWADLDETYSDYALVPVEFEDVADYVLVTLRSSAQMQGSRLRVEGKIWHLWRISEGKPQEAWTFGTRTEALQAVGLRE